MAIEDQLMTKLGQLAEVSNKAGDAIRILNKVQEMLMEGRLFDLTAEQRQTVQARCLAVIDAVKTAAQQL